MRIGPDLLTALFVGLFAACAQAGDFVLAERGRPADCTIVIPSGATAVQRYAAKELQDFVARLTDVKLAVTEGSVPVAGRAVVFSDAGAANPREDGFRLVVTDRTLKIVAAADCGGALYGVYEILERFGGCRWYASWCEHVPRADRLALPEGLDETHEPAFAMRQTWWYDPLKNHAFAARLRMNTHQWSRMEPKFGGERFRFGGGLGSCHTFETLVPIAKYGKDHPEYFAFRDGARRVTPPKDGVQWYVQLCLTNPDVLKLVVAGVKERIRRDPGARFYGVSQNDNPYYCQCPTCAAVDAEEDSHAGTVVRFVNAVAEAVEKEFPGVVIETLAYQFSRKPPKKTRLRANVVPCLCSIECDFANPIVRSPYRQNVDFMSDIRGWRAMTESLYVWDYTTDFAHYPLPFANVYALQDNIRFFRDQGVRFLFEQGAYQGRHADFAELKAWLLAKWMWNPELPMKPLLDDFFAGYYGSGAPFVRTYFEELHARQRAVSADPKRPLTIFIGSDNSALDDELLERAATLLAKAEAATKDEPTANYNVRMAAFSVDYARLERQRANLDVKASFDPDVNAAADIRRLSRLAALQLARLDEAKDIRLCEPADRHAQRIDAWKGLAKGPTIALAKDGRIAFEERFLSLARKGTWGDFVDDPLAADGRALKLFNSHFEWCCTFPMRQVRFRPGVRYAVRVRLRVEPKPGATGEAFWAGVYDPVAKVNRGKGAYVRVADVKPGYAWYDVAVWEPKPGDYFWIGPGRFDKKTGVSSIEGLWVDRIELFMIRLIP